MTVAAKKEWTGVNFDPWTVYDLGGGEACAHAHGRHIAGEGLSTGEGALLGLLVMAWLVFEADRRVPR